MMVLAMEMMMEAASRRAKEKDWTKEKMPSIQEKEVALTSPTLPS
jgi:hypothetical protein